MAAKLIIIDLCHGYKKMETVHTLDTGTCQAKACSSGYLPKYKWARREIFLNINYEL